MSDIATSQEFGTALLKALGLENQKVTSLTLKLEVNQPVKLEVIRYVDTEQTDRAIQKLSKYTVHLEPQSPFAQAVEELSAKVKTPSNYG